jgi:Endosomal/lysosomal potassium channel TMEM175
MLAGNKTNELAETNRLEALSDGAFAIVITLLVIEIHRPVDQGGNVSLRVNSRLHHIGIGRTHTGTRVILLIADLDIRIIHAATGEILRQLTLDPTCNYQGTGAPKGPTQPKTKQPEPS